jgi:transcriptional regulator with XRE-family HTH domain
MMSMKTSYRELDYVYGTAIQKLRAAIGLTQAGLANRLGVSWRTVAGWEAGSSYPRTEHFKELIALAIQQQAFAVGHEAEEIRVLWKVAHQKTLLDERWLCMLLDQRNCPQGQALQLHVEPEAVEETMTTELPGGRKQEDRGGLSLPACSCPARTTGAPPPLPGGSFPQTPSQTNADQPQRSPVVGGEAEPSTISTAPDQTMAENFLHRRGRIGAKDDPHSPHPAADKTRGRRKWLMGILIALVILTIIGSAETLFFQARDHATTQPNKAAREQASKTAVAQYPGYLSGKGTLVFFDPLSQQDGSKWSSSSNNTYGSSCQFTGGTYHIRKQQVGGSFSWCAPNGVFSNFAFEVQLTIMQGDCGGMTFRGDYIGHFYFFRICQGGTYKVTKYMSDSGSDSKVLQDSNSSAIKTGLGQQNKIALVANGSTMTFYVNEQQIDQEQDSSYTSGSIALIAHPFYAHATDVAYSNARLWAL